MSINKSAVDELYKREGYNSAHFYLVEHENMNNQEAQDYLNKQYNLLMDNLTQGFHPPFNFENILPTFYHECCNEMDSFDDSVHKCNTVTQRIFNKVKSLFYAR